MFDLRLIRNDPERVRRGLADKGARVELDRAIQLDEERRRVTVEADARKAERNRVSEEIGVLKKSGGGAEELVLRMRRTSDEIQELDRRLALLDRELDALLLTFPNLAHDSVPVGPDAGGNVVLRSWGTPRRFDFPVVPHHELTEKLGLTDFARASRLSGAGFALFKGEGAALVRALIQFMLDLHTREHGYTEIWPPYLVNRAAMTGTGQLPKLEEDMYHTDADDLFLIPTAEVPITNMHREELLDGEALPLTYVGYTACFRREAGAAGKETRGLSRLHQFDKVELVRITAAERSYEEHELLLSHAEEVLRRLELPYRVNLLCTGDLSFAAAKCYDLEAWSPGQEKWLEVSSVSNFEDFQARRMGLRYRPAKGEKPRPAHTLNGSGVALPRTIIALVENHQTPDGRIMLPAALRPYLGGRGFFP